ncbi:MAG: hypothetical protein ACI9VM_000239 [Candidatus Azotimanducaceae bacterium]|jgi:hypothetical protein
MTSHSHKKVLSVIVVLALLVTAVYANSTKVLIGLLGAENLKSLAAVVDQEQFQTIVLPAQADTSLNLTTYRNMGERLTMGVDTVSFAAISFDLSSLPTDTQIIDAKLQLFDTRQFDTANLEVYRVDKPWKEFEASRSNYRNGEAWEVRPGDYRDADNVLQGNAPFSIERLTDNDTPKLVTVDVTSLTKAWKNDTYDNNGFLLKMSQGTHHFASREDPDPDKRPQLIIRVGNSGETPTSIPTPGDPPTEHDPEDEPGESPETPPVEQPPVVEPVAVEIPQNFFGTTELLTHIQLTWDVPDISLEVQKYRVYRNGIKIDDVSDEKFEEYLGAINQNISYTIQYVFDDETTSALSNPLDISITENGSTISNNVDTTNL